MFKVAKAPFALVNRVQFSEGGALESLGIVRDEASFTAARAGMKSVLKVEFHF